MDRKHEEAQAQVLWAFIQQLRERDDELVRGLDGLSPEVATELAGLLRTARDVSVALQLEGHASEGAATRVREAIAARAAQPPRRNRRLFEWLPRFDWGRKLSLAGGLAAALLAGVALGRGVPGPDPLERPAPGIAALSHDAARRDIPRLVAGKLGPAEARAVLWHLAHCDECFRQYQGMMGQASRLPHDGPQQFTLANWPVTGDLMFGRTD